MGLDIVRERVHDLDASLSVGSYPSFEERLYRWRYQEEAWIMPNDLALSSVRFQEGVKYLLR